MGNFESGMRWNPENHHSLHRPVLLEEVLHFLSPTRPGIYIDATLGGGGHARALLRRTSSEMRVLALDRDQEAVRRGRVLGDEFGSRVEIIHGNFAYLKEILKSREEPRVMGIMADLGLSSYQLSDPRRGFSFSQEGPLDMRMDQEQSFTAAELLQTASEEELARIFREYGEERRSRSLARFIVQERQRCPLTTTSQLAGLVSRIVPRSRGGLNPATRSFQALRIAVNAELAALRLFLEAGIDILLPKGRMCVVSFHSLEDRMVKEKFRQEERGCTCPPHFPQCTCGKKPRVKLLTRRPVRPRPEEVDANPRSRSARLRAVEKLAEAET